MVDTPETTPAVAADEDYNALFGDLRKKKKKKKLVEEQMAQLEINDSTVTTTVESVEGESTEPARAPSPIEATNDAESQELQDDIFSSAISPKASAEATTTADSTSTQYFLSASAKDDSEEPWANNPTRDYTYVELLNRVFRILRQHNPEMTGEKKKQSIVPPIVQREGSKKTCFANLAELCERMHRSPEHVTSYLFAELGTTGSTDAAQRLIIKGRFQQKQIENVLRRYIMEYVSCKTCKSLDTILNRENRMYFQQCLSCGATKSVQAVKTGFKAQTEKRSIAARKAAV